MGILHNSLFLTIIVSSFTLRWWLGVFHKSSVYNSHFYHVQRRKDEDRRDDHRGTKSFGCRC
jgi:hypothetical protein